MVFGKLLPVLAMGMLAGSLSVAGEKALMHCFAYTPIATATQAEWDAFAKASDALPKKIPGIKRVWYGKLRAPLNLVMGADAADRKRVTTGEKDVTGKLALTKREYGMCMEMKDADTLTAYAQHPYHKEWLATYEKVRVAGTTTYDILGQ
ncbi:hypothetical protein F183_A39270 [Bryobacterales bacterium F-183]|nr:hypothetical protein F183_A39270 [Bryobacterales bacterium F-183]